MPLRKKRVLIYIYLILIRILIRKHRGKALLTVNVNELVLTVKLMVNNAGRIGIWGRTKLRYYFI